MPDVFKSHTGGVLIVDDNPIDIDIQRRVMARTNRVGHIDTCTDSVAALARYKNYASQGEDAFGGPPPRLLLLDLNMPRINGLDFALALDQLDLDFEHHVVLLTSSKTIKIPSNPVSEVKQPDYPDCISAHLIKPMMRPMAERLVHQYF
jgi:CheY-like chemotaxis protein